MESWTGSTWWRFDNYEIVGGTHVVPAVGAQLKWYDLLTDHERYWGGRVRRDEPPPYIELARLTLRDREQIVEWCARYGLLGIAPHRTLEIRLWPRWELVGRAGESSPDGSLFPHQVRWDRRRTIPLGPRASRPEAVGASADGVDHLWGKAEMKGLGKAGDPVSRMWIPSLREDREWFRRPMTKSGVLVAWESGGTAEVDLVLGYGQFFPRIEGVTEWVAARAPEEILLDEPPAAARHIHRRLERRWYPLPRTDEFRRQYGEPLPLFREYADKIVQALETWQQIGGVESYEELDSILEESRLLQELDPILRSVRPALRPVYYAGGLRWQSGWQFPSLYAALHWMMVQDFPLGGRLLRRCVKCGAFFATGNDQTLYCSVQCRKALQMTRYRERQRQA